MFSYSLTPGTASPYQTAVTVKVWKCYLLRNKSDITRALCTYSLDNGPFQEDSDGCLLFDFTQFDWQNNLEALLVKNAIHYKIIQRFEHNPLEHLLKKNIFIAGDDQHPANVLCQALQGAGYHVRITGPGEEIIDGNFSRADLFILDKNVHHADSISICRHLRLHPVTKNAPVIVISEQRHIAKEALLAGASDIIEKPFTMHYLLNVVARYIHQA